MLFVQCHTLDLFVSTAVGERMSTPTAVMNRLQSESSGGEASAGSDKIDWQLASRGVGMAHL